MRALLGAGLAFALAFTLSACPHPDVKPPHVEFKPPPRFPGREPGGIHIPEPDSGGIHLTPAGTAAADRLKSLGERSDTAKEVICTAIEGSDDAAQVRNGTMSQDEFVRKYQGILIQDEGAAAIGVAQDIYQLLHDAQAGDIVGVSVDLGCLGS
jgi:hypothetical protein